MEYGELMKALGESLGLDGFAPDAKGRYSLSVDDDVVTFVERSRGRRMDMFAKICELPEENGDRVCRVLLSAMAPGGGVEDGVFFIAPDGKSVCLRRTDELDGLDLAACREALEAFTEALVEWRGAIGDFLRAIPVIVAAQEKDADESRSFGMGAEGFMQV